LPGGAKLPFELERWDAHAGHLDAWVRVPTLTATTQLELHYGDPSSASAPDPAAVFAGFEAVWHMSDVLTSNKVADATGKHDGTAEGLASTAQVAGKLGGAITFNGSNQVSFTNPLTGNTPHTISAWMLQPNGGNGPFDSVMTVGSTSSGAARFMDSRFTGGAM